MADLIFNGDFELGNVGFTSDYVTPGIGVTEGTYEILTDPHLSNPYAVSYHDHTTGSGLMMAVNGAVIPNVVVWSETVRVRPNTEYDFSIWVSSWYPTSPAQLDILFNGNSALAFTATSTAGVWQQFTTSWRSDADTSLTISIFDRNTAASGNDFALDDISLTPSPAPEPAGAVLFGAGALGLLAYHWTRRKLAGG
jgi:hypothetical protein